MITDLVDASKEVLETMAFAKIEGWQSGRPPTVVSGYHLTGMVGLTGALTGLIAIHCDKDFALRLASNMLGDETLENERVVLDAVGEVANMIAGSFKMRLSSNGTPVNISLPSVVSGSDYRVENPSQTRREVIEFQSDFGAFFLELVVENGHAD
jgi:chemotaxis protein CheX